MSSTCTPILVGVASLISEIPLPSKTAKFPFRTMGYSPWSSKNLIDQNWLKKFMQVCIDVTCKHTYFGGCGLFDFGDTAIKNGQISLSNHGLYSMVIKKFNWSELAQKIHSSRDWCQVHAHQFWWAWPFWFRRYRYPQKRPNFPFRAWTIVHGHQKI